MRTTRTLIAAAAGLLAVLLPLPSFAQGPAIYLAKSEKLAWAFDLDGESADANQSLAPTQIVDSTSYTVAANPDTCRLVNITMVDANSSITVGTLTIVGTDCWDYPLTVTFDMSGGSGIRTGTVVDTANAPKRASGAYFKTITSISNGVVTGEGGAADTVAVGYAGINSANSYPLYGRQTTGTFLSGRRWVDVFGKFDVPVLVKNGATTTDVTAVSSSTTDPFQNVSAGDILIFNVNGAMYERKVVTRTDADNVIVNAAVPIPTAGVNFSYKKFYLLADPIDGWIPVLGYDSVVFQFDVDANANTGGVVYTLECTPEPDDVGAAITMDTATVATGNTGDRGTSLDLRLLSQFVACRAGLKFGTGDDGDGANEDINLTIGFRQ